MAFLIDAPSGLFLIDCGSPGQQDRVLRKMSALGRTDLKLIWITHAHYDHYGSAAALREITGAQIGVHQADACYMVAGESPLGASREYGFIYLAAHKLLSRIWKLTMTPPDFTLADGESLVPYGLDATILHTPGHTPGHTCVLSSGGVAFVGDLIGGFPRLRLQGLLATDWSQLPGSLTRLQAAHPQWIYTGHVRHRITGSRLASIRGSR